MMIPVIRYLSHIFPHQTWPFASIFSGHWLLPVQRTNISHPWEKENQLPSNMPWGEDLLIPNRLNSGEGVINWFPSIISLQKMGPHFPSEHLFQPRDNPFIFGPLIWAISQKSAQGPILLQGAPPNPSTSINQSSHPEVAATSTKLQDANTVCVEHRRGRSPRRRFGEAWECDGVTGLVQALTYVVGKSVTEYGQHPGRLTAGIENTPLEKKNPLPNHHFQVHQPPKWVESRENFHGWSFEGSTVTPRPSEKSTQFGAVIFSDGRNGKPMCQATHKL